MADATYAVVDMSKKKKNKNNSRSLQNPSVEEHVIADSMFPVPDNKRSLASAYDELDATYSTITLNSDEKNEALPCDFSAASTTRSTKKTEQDKIESMSNKRFICILVTLAVVSVAAIACFVFLFVKVNSEAAAPVELSSAGNESALTILYLQQLNHSLSSLSEKVEEMAMNNSRELFVLHIQYEEVKLIAMNNSQQFSQLCDNLHEQIQKNTLLINSFNESGLSRLLPVPSCAALPPSSPSGYYWVRNSIGSAVHVYCDMNRSCGNVTGGWIRVAELDMTESSQQCPSGLTQNVTGNLRTCVRSSDSAGCSSVTLPTINVHYSSVCGRIIAYQFGATNAFRAKADNNISLAYVDGVSLTHGNPRQHIWTFAAALDKEASTNDHSNYCPCIHAPGKEPPDFVGQDYFCDSGQQQHVSTSTPEFYSDDPLWDGAGCGSQNTCCTFNTPPWFYKQLPHPTTDDIEMRVCRNEGNDNEDIALQIFEIFVHV